MNSKKPSCLIICSSSPQGVSAQSFIHSFTLTHSAFNVHIVTPEGKPIEFDKIDDNSRRWLNEFKTKPFSVPAKLEDVEPSKYAAILIPSGMGCLYDLFNHKELSKFLQIFIEEMTPLCAVGYGVAALCGVKNRSAEWGFNEYSLTGPPICEMTTLNKFSELPLVFEDFVKDCGATFSSSKPDCMHVVIDRHLITGQNDMSTLSAVQNLILLCNAKQGKK